jgi:ADP-ribose pyrophosphatase YjhB (NUDIX family)
LVEEGLERTAIPFAKGKMRETTHGYALHNPETNSVIASTINGNMPKWWRAPSDEVRMMLAERYKAEGRVLPITTNMVTLIVHSDASQKLVMQVCSFISPQGKPVAKASMLSLHGGPMEAGESTLDALLRIAKEELGIELDTYSLYEYGANFLFDHYDPENGRTNHVFQLRASYRELLLLLANRSGPAIQVLLNPQGMGRAFLDEANLKAVMGREGMVTPISHEILSRWLEKV